LPGLPNKQNANGKVVSFAAREHSVLFVLINAEQPLNLRHFILRDGFGHRQIEALIEVCVVVGLVLIDDLPVFCSRTLFNPKLFLPKFLRPLTVLAFCDRAMLAQDAKRPTL
jgi:hypothetical protein